MPHIEQTEEFADWLLKLKDRRAAMRINGRINRLAGGYAGDWKSVGDGVREMRINQGPGYRVYYTERDGQLTILLCGGDKGTQDRDIARAKALALGLEE